MGKKNKEKLEKVKVKTHGVSHYFPAESKKIGYYYLLLTQYTRSQQLLKFNANLTQLFKCEQRLHGDTRTRLNVICSTLC